MKINQNAKLEKSFSRDTKNIKTIIYNSEHYINIKKS